MRPAVPAGESWHRFRNARPDQVRNPSVMGYFRESYAEFMNMTNIRSFISGRLSSLDGGRTPSCVDTWKNIMEHFVCGGLMFA